MTPFPYRAEDVHLTLRPTHQTREPVEGVLPSFQIDRVSDYFSATYYFSDPEKPYKDSVIIKPRYRVGQVGYVAEPWVEVGDYPCGVILARDFEHDGRRVFPAISMPSWAARTFQRCEGVSVEKADDGWVFVYDWKQITREEAEAGV